MPHTSAPTHDDRSVFTREVVAPVLLARLIGGLVSGMVMGNKARSGKAEGARCRRHPRDHRQQGAGVCASCLRERLSHLSLSASLPSVVRGDEESEYYDEEGASSCSEASTAYSSEGSSAASSGCASPGGEPAFHDEMRRAARVSLLMRHERVVGDADAVAVLLARREQRRRTATSFWAKLLHATRGGGKKEEEGCSLAARAKTLEESRGAPRPSGSSSDRAISSRHAPCMHAVAH